MKKEKFFRQAFKRIVAFVLAVAFIMSGMNVTGWSVKAEESDIILPVVTGSQQLIADSNNNADVEIAKPTSYNTIQSLIDAGYTKLDIEYRISDSTQGGTGTPGMQPYYAYGSDWTYYTGSVWKNIADAKEGTISLPFTAGTGKSDELKRFGLQICNVSNVNIEIISAKLVNTGGTSTGGSGGGDTSVAAEGLSATVQQKSGNSDWAEYNYSITNGNSSPVKGLKVVIPFSGTVNNLQSWNCSVTKVDNTIVIRHTAEIAANSSYSCIGSDTIKFGFSGGATLGTPVVSILTEEDNASQLKYPLTGTTQDVAYNDTPVGKHGALHLQEVSGYSAPIIVDEAGNPYQLRGASTHGMQWNEMHPYVNKASFQSLRDEWGVNMVRLVSYVTQSGYTQGAQALLDSKIQEGVEAATDLGMYVIVDWHIHEEDPHATKAQALEFFKKYATMYKDYNNVIFEICNEPIGVVWYNGNGNDLYSYCKEVVQAIRDCGSNSLIVCGTNTWSQDVDDVAKKPLKDDGFEDILYTFHFYSGSHYDDKMSKVRTATAAGTPIFVTEFGICDASGNGGYDTGNADAWIKLCDQYNISYACWSLCNKNESASYLLPSCNKTTGGWLEEDLSTTGLWLVNTYRAHEEAEKEAENPGAVSSVKLDKTTLSLGKGESATLIPTVSPATATDTSVTWSSDTPAVATVDKDGKVTAVAAGTATITVKTTDGGKTATCKVTVTAPGITLNKTSLALKVGASGTLISTVTGVSDATVIWSSSNTEVATVDKTGKVTALSGGEAIITATVGSGDNAVQATCTVKVTKNTPEVTVPSSITVEAGSKLSDIVFDNTNFSADVDGTFTWETMDKTLTINDNNTKAVISFIPTDKAQYDSVNNIEITILVIKKKYDSVPDAPELSSATVNTVTLKEVTTAPSVQYGLKQGTVYQWQNENVFTGLSEYTSYEFAMRYLETDIYEASEAGKTLKVTTFFNDANKYKIDLDKLTEENYVEAHGGTITYDVDSKVLTLNKEGKVYTITGSNKEVEIHCADGVVVKLKGTDCESIFGDGELTVQLENKSVVAEGIKAEKRVTIENGSSTGVGSLTVTSGEENAAIDSPEITINGGEIDATGVGNQKAIKATNTEATGILKLLGGIVIGNANSEPPIEADKIILDGGQVISNSSPIYSTTPVDSNGEAVDVCYVSYENGTESSTASIKKGSEITLPPLPAKEGYKADGWKLEGEDAVSAPGETKTINEDVTFIAVYTEITGDLEVSVSEAKDLIAGYEGDSGVTVTITNNTNVTIDEIILIWSNDKEFTISNDDITDLVAGESVEVTVELKNALGVGSYTTDLTITCVEGECEEITESITRVVGKAASEKPENAPEILTVTQNSVTLVPVSVTDKKVEYGIKQDGSYVWQTSNIFEDLESYTTYSFAVRYAETGNTNASEASDSITATTLMDEKDKYIVDLTKLDDEAYVEAHDGSISYDAQKKELTLMEEETYTITGNNSDIKIITKENITLNLDNAKLEAIEADKDIEIVLKGTSSVTSTTEGQPAVKAEGSVTISQAAGTVGSVAITGGDNVAGIIANEVTITSGTVTVTGGKNAAGIEADRVTVSGGTVTVTGQGDKPAIKADVTKFDVPVTTNNGSDYKEDDGNTTEDSGNVTSEEPKSEAIQNPDPATTTQSIVVVAEETPMNGEEEDGNKIKPALLCSNILLQKGKSFLLKTNNKSVKITKVTYANSKSKKIVKASSSGKVTAKKTGSASLKVTYKYDGVSYTKTVKVKVQKNQVISLTKKSISLTMKRNKKVSLVNTSNMLSSKGMKFSTSNKRCVKVSSSGVVTPRKKGTAKITVKIGKIKYMVKIKVK